MNIVRSSRFFARADGVLEAPPIQSASDLFALLHELGHVYHRHEAERTDLLGPEAEAWRYALGCIAPEYRAECVRLAVRSMRTYADHLEHVYGEDWSDERLEELL